MARKKSSMSSRGGRSGGGFRGIFGTILGLILAGTFLFAIGKSSGADNWYDAAKVGAARVESWITSSDFDPSEILDKISPDGSGIPSSGSGSGGKGGSKGDGGKGGSSSPVDVKMSTKAAGKALSTIKVQEPDKKVSYDRKDWKHWNGLSPSCWSIRDEALSQQGTDIVLLDSKKKVTKDRGKACSIKSGVWKTPFYGETITNPSKIDLDHHVPLGYANKHGGASWSKEKKQKYANSMNPGHLIAVSASANRSKGDRGPGAWMPKNKAYTCSYAKNWISVSTTWKLTTSKSDAAALKKAIGTC